MPASPPAVFSPPSGSTPGTPAAVFTPAAGGSPGSPAAVFSAPGGGSPSSPAAVFTAPGGGSPAAPEEVFTPVAAGGSLSTVALTGSLTDDGSPVTFPGLTYAGEVASNQFAWTSDGTWPRPATGTWYMVLVLTGSSAAVARKYVDTVIAAAWENLAIGSGRTDPDGVVFSAAATGANGAGGTATAAFTPGLTAPEEVFTPISGGGSPSAPAAVFTAPGGGSPAAPAEVFTPLSGAAPDKPPMIFGVEETALLDGMQTLTDNGQQLTDP